jgi:hypothetical protein
LRHSDRAQAGFDELFDADHEPIEGVPYDGATFGAAFFGWLVASALAVLIVSAIAGIGTAIGWERIGNWSAAHADEGALVAAGLVLVTVTVSEFAGGYVGGRMIHTGGAKQGFGVWLLGMIAAAAITAVAYLVARRYDLTGRVDIPSRIAAIDARGGLIAALILLSALLAAVAGGVSGNRYHRRVNQTSPY